VLYEDATFEWFLIVLFGVVLISSEALNVAEESVNRWALGSWELAVIDINDSLRFVYTFNIY
jgi:hypothetical protein